MVIGIPRAFLYHRYHTLWTSFFETLEHEVVLSPETDKSILHRGTMLSIDEACLSSKIYLGHVDALIGRCDAIFVPRIASLGHREILCTKFEALYDIVYNTFRDRDIRLLDYNIDVRKGHGELGAFVQLGKTLNHKRRQSLYAYMYAKQQEKAAHQHAVEEQLRTLERRDAMRVLVVGHGYNVYDAYIGKPVLEYLRNLGAVPILADVVDRKQAVNRSHELTDTLPWIYNRELMGAVQEYRDQVDGIILMSAFPCGPDSLVNDILVRRVKGLPILQLVLDGQEGTAGVETRLESFVDIIRYRKEER